MFHKKQSIILWEDQTSYLLVETCPRKYTVILDRVKSGRIHVIRQTIYTTSLSHIGRGRRRGRKKFLKWPKQSNLLLKGSSHIVSTSLGSKNFSSREIPVCFKKKNLNLPCR